MTKKLIDILKYALSLALAAALLYFSFRGVKWEDFIASLRHCRWGGILVAMVAGVFACWVRALRWRELIAPFSPATTKVTMFNAINIGYIVNLALPRVGEFVRCGVVTRRSQSATYDKVLGTVALERVWDVLLLMAFTVAMVVAMWGRFGEFFVDDLLTMISGRMSIGFGLIVLAVLAVCALMAWLTYRLRDRVKPAKVVWDFISGLWDGAISCLRMKNGWVFVAYSFVIWAMYWLMSLSVLWAVQGMDVLGLAPEFAGAIGKLEGLGLTDALFLMIAGSFSSLVPVPGGFGSFHYIVALALSSVYGVPFEVGIIFATLSHGAQVFTMLLFGALSYAYESVKK